VVVAAVAAFVTSMLTACDPGPTFVARDIAAVLDPGRHDIGELSNTWGDNLVFDYNADGIDDVVLANHWHPQLWKLMLGTASGGFVLHTAFKQLDRHGAAAGDFGSEAGPPDGRIDLYLIRGAARGTADDKTNELYFQRANGTLSANFARTRGVDDPSGRGRAVATAETGTNRQDGIFVGNNEPEPGSTIPSEDRLFANHNGWFHDFPTPLLPSQQNTQAATVADYDGDGWEDILTLSYGPRLYRNVNGTSYVRRQTEEHLPTGQWWDAEFADMDSDHRVDLLLMNDTTLQVRLNRGGSPYFSDVAFSMALANGQAIAVGDADGNGAQDILVVQGRVGTEVVQRADRLLLNRGAGMAFDTLAVPQPPLSGYYPSMPTHRGEGASAATVPEYRGNRDAFIVNNGAWRMDLGTQRGYRQFIVLEPTPSPADRS
jgi:hypothetical protein